MCTGLPLPAVTRLKMVSAKSTNSRAIRARNKGLSWKNPYNSLNRDTQGVTSYTWHTFFRKNNYPHEPEFSRERTVNQVSPFYLHSRLAYCQWGYLQGSTRRYLALPSTSGMATPIGGLFRPLPPPLPVKSLHPKIGMGTVKEPRSFLTVKSKKGFAPLDSIALLTLPPNLWFPGKKSGRNNIRENFWMGVLKTQQFRYAYDSKGNRIMIEEP